MGVKPGFHSDGAGHDHPARRAGRAADQPGGLTWDWVMNSFGVAQKVKKVLESSPTLSER